MNQAYMKRVVHNMSEARAFLRAVGEKIGWDFEQPQLIEIKRYSPPRSLPQNSKLHAMLNELADHIGYSASELKDWMKIEYGPKKLFRFGTTEKLIPKSTAEYSKREMMDFIDHVERVAAEAGVEFHE